MAVHRHAAADDHVDGPHAGDADFHGRAGGPFRRCGFGWRHREGAGIEDVERAYVSEPRDGHVEQLAVPQRALADRLLSGIGDSLDDPSGLPRGQAREPRGSSIGSVEGRNVAVDAGLDDALAFQQVPHPGADRLLGLINSHAPRQPSYAAMRARIRSYTSCTSLLCRHRRSSRPAPKMTLRPPPPRFRSVTSIA